jgi:hypothetical protein
MRPNRLPFLQCQKEKLLTEASSLSILFAQPGMAS